MRLINIEIIYICKFVFIFQRIDTDADTFYIAASSNSEKEQWIGQIGKFPLLFR